jgi:hypothetical protein
MMIFKLFLPFFFTIIDRHTSVFKSVAIVQVNLAVDLRAVFVLLDGFGRVEALLAQAVVAALSAVNSLTLVVGLVVELALF